jgi:single-stranded-DNA-specific exonuclease
MKPKKNWKICNRALTDGEQQTILDAGERFGLCPSIVRLLIYRGYDSVEKIEKFLCYAETVLHDPFEMKDMKEAAERVLLAVKNGENIAIYGDYDADGVSSTAMLYLYLEDLSCRLHPSGKGIDLGYYIPKRISEGYGMSADAVRKLAEKKVDLIVTVDTGISAAKEIELASELGMDVVVTDHHECPEELPRACAVVDPHRPDCGYPFKELAGVGVAFKLIIAVEMLLAQGSEAERAEVARKNYYAYADLVTLGTVADVMPLVGENRMIVSLGLEMMKAKPRPGIKALLACASAGKQGKLTASSIGFGIAPRINAAGRMNEASKAVELLLLTREDEACDEGAEILADILCEFNKDRQSEESRIIDSIFEQVEQTHDFEHDHFIVVEGDNWHSGVIGIAASRVTDRYHLPTVLITYNDSTEPNAGQFEVGKGSCRSIEGVNLKDALDSCADCLVKYGGHELAAGLSVTRGNVAELRRRLNDFVRDLPSETWEDEISADSELAAGDITMDFALQLLRFEPYGNANPTPLFYLEKAKIVKSYSIGGGKHLKLVLEKDGIALNAVMFGASYECFNLSVGELVDVMFNVDINEYNHVRSVQLIVREMRENAEFLDVLDASASRYEAVMAGARFSKEEQLLPTREDFKQLYMFFRRMDMTGQTKIPEKQLLMTLKAENPKISLALLRIMMDILDEMKLCLIERTPNRLVEVQVNTKSPKVNLEDSAILGRLISQCNLS